MKRASVAYIGSSSCIVLEGSTTTGRWWEVAEVALRCPCLRLGQVALQERRFESNLRSPRANVSLQPRPRPGLVNPRTSPAPAMYKRLPASKTHGEGRGVSPAPFLRLLGKK